MFSINVLTFLLWNDLIDLRAFTVVLYSDQSVQGMGKSDSEDDEKEADLHLNIEERERIFKISTQRGVISFVTGCNGNPITTPPIQIRDTRMRSKNSIGAYIL